ncbi:MAG TPA: hypothetical protein VGM43_03295 [Bryobacteraceae bacterium]|jgi:hypothetical protein
MAPELFCAADVRQTRLDESTVAYSMITRGWTTLSRSEAAVLDCCQSFGTLEEHAATAVQRLSIEDTDSAVGILRRLSERRLLVSRSDILAALSINNDSGPASDTEGIEALSIPTRNRPESLYCALSSYMAHLKPASRKLSFWIVDDSTVDSARSQNVALLNDLSQKRNVDIYYTDRRRRSSFASDLSNVAHIPKEVARFALLGDIRMSSVSHGAARNSQLLGLGRRKWITVDDDTVCNLRTHPGARPGLVIDGEGHPSEYAFFRSHEEACRYGMPTTRDFVGGHEALLGTSLPTLISRAGVDNICLKSLRASIFRRSEDSVPRVAVTGTGFFGDSASDWSGYLLLLNGANFNRLVSTPHFSEYMSGRLLSIGVTSVSVSDTAPIIRGLSMGVDGAVHLPPFLPVDRGEEYLFGTISGFCVPGYLSAIDTLQIEHRPRETRYNSTWWANDYLRPTAVVAILVRAYCSSGVAIPRRDRLAGLGTHLIDLGNTKSAHFIETVLTRCWQTMDGVIRALKQRQVACSAFPQVVEAIDLTVSALQKQVEQWESLDQQSVWIALQDCVQQFGLLLSSWDRIRRAAEHINSRPGRALFHPVRR